MVGRPGGVTAGWLLPVERGTVTAEYWVPTAMECPGDYSRRAVAARKYCFADPRIGGIQTTHTITLGRRIALSHNTRDKSSKSRFCRSASDIERLKKASHVRRSERERFHLRSLVGTIWSSLGGLSGYSCAEGRSKLGARGGTLLSGFATDCPRRVEFLGRIRYGQ
jgi:hypothetical protein